MVGNTDRKQKIYQSIDQFLNRCIELKDSDTLERYFKFMRKVPNHAPFNNILVFIQNPNCSYYATPSQWSKRFQRTIKPNSRPMVVMLAFGPVEFVYDLTDTEGEDIPDDKIMLWWRQNGGMLGIKVFSNTLKNLERIGVGYRLITDREYYKRVSSLTAGYISWNHSLDEISIALHPRYTSETTESYGVLCHEVAHLLLGHLGPLSRQVAKKGDITTKILVSDRSYLSKDIREVEAELTAWIVFDRYGIKKDSEAYVASWLTSLENYGELQISEVLKVAGRIYEMGKRPNALT